MRDTLFIRGLEVRGILGIEDWERRERQTIRIDLELACDASKAAAEDDIEDAVNYRSVTKAVIRHVEESRYRLVETLAERLAELVQREHGVSWLKLRVSKPGAVRFSQDVGVEIERGRRDAP
jgi:dihydroneopterin aldolase